MAGILCRGGSGGGTLHEQRAEGLDACTRSAPNEVHKKTIH